MLEPIKTFQTIVVLIAFGVLVGLGWALAHMAVAWPASAKSGAAAVICLLLVIIAYLI
jgi:hypothetical protein